MTDLRKLAEELAHYTRNYVIESTSIYAKLGEHPIERILSQLVRVAEQARDEALEEVAKMSDADAEAWHKLGDEKRSTLLLKEVALARAFTIRALKNERSKTDE